MKEVYAAFLASKAIRAKERGLDRVPELAPHLFPFQSHSVDFALRAGCAGLFLDTGLGKTECQLEWCQKAIEATNDRALILMPLAVAGQTKRRADRWGYEARVIREQSDTGPGINICNYDRLEKLDPDEFGVVSLDEASILKSFTGKTTRALIAAFRGHRFKLVATATPAPNDHMELGNYAEYLEVMAANEMLSRFFINDTSTASQEWRLKAHAVNAFWDWMASFSRMAGKPSDLTADPSHDAGFELPPFDVIRHRARDSRIDRELQDLFGTPALSATTLHDVKRQTSEARAEKVATVVDAEKAEPWLIWVDTDYEADAVKRVLPDAVEIRGSQSADEKEEKIEAFATGKVRHIIGKPSMLGFGLDWSHCARMVFVGRGYSYETWYQAVRRCWRFGQKRDVVVHLIVAEGETEIGRVIDRKADDHVSMKAAMVAAMRRATGQAAVVKAPYIPKTNARLPSWLG
jgi:superfamily II DNA or RNA helicase